MSPRHAILPLGAVLVLCLGVYLFVEVRAAPITPAVNAARVAASAPPAEAPPAEAPADEPAKPPLTARSAPLPRPAAPPVRAVDGARAEVPTLSPPPATGPKLETAMAEANKAYDRGDFDEAKSLAGRLLISDPTNVRMLRIMVSASCLDGDTTVAQAHYARLPQPDQEQMKIRCARYGITFPDPP